MDAICTPADSVKLTEITPLRPLVPAPTTETEVLPHNIEAEQQLLGAILTNNARSETVVSRPTYRAAWAAGQRCLIPAAWYQEPNWETGKNIWWRPDTPQR